MRQRTKGCGWTNALHQYNYGKPICRLALALLLLIAMPQPHWAETTSSQSNSLGIKSLSPALATSVPAAMQGLKDRSIHLVDVRPGSRFEQYRIPGAINISLHAIRTKGFLKAKPVVLVNEGFALGQLADTCRTLNEMGFKATILAGGLVAWKAKNGRLVGDPFDMQQLYQVLPQQLMQQANDGHHVIVDASDEATARSPFVKGAVRLDLAHSAHAVQQLKTMMRKKSSDPFATYLIYTNDGQANAHIQRTLSQAGIHTVFYLAGGSQAVQQQIEYINMAAKPRQDRTLSTSGCPACARQSR